MLDRLKDASFHPNFSYTPTPLSEYAKPGMAEQIGSYAGSGLGALGAIDNMMGVGKTAGNVMNMVGKIPGLGSVGNIGSKIGSFLGGSAGNTAGASGAGAAGAATGLLGKAVPIAGAVTGGLGLIHDHGLGGNIMNGVSAGASLGSIVPGLGTAVGAGIGAGVGALRSLFNIGGPSKEELAGRDAHSSIINSMTAGATPEEIQEAHNSGWEKPQDALALITLRDRMNQKGLDSSKANALMDQLFKATKIGPQAVSNVYNQIAQVMS
jgi:hypothetical protein